MWGGGGGVAPKVTLILSWGGGGGGGGAPKVTLILSYIRMLGPFMGFIFVIFNIVGAFIK